MAPEWDEKSVFLEALGLEPGQREAFLRGACPDDAARERIRTLLRRHNEQTVGLPTLASGGGDPKRIDEFMVIRRLGAGGMGVVYLAEDTVLGRRVALKVLAGHLTDSEQFVGRFRDEARHAASLEHHGIVSVYKAGFDGSHHYIVSEFVDGTTLGEVIEQEQHRPASPATGPIREWHRRCAQIVAAIAEALDYSHRNGIIHRDVKPSNILIDQAGTPRLTDFGIAKHVSGKAHTRSSEVLGSCHYMSPEQAAVAERPVDRRSDIFSLGVVLFEMLALRRPFDGRDASQVLRAVISEAAPRLRSLNRLIPRDLETICSKALEKDPVQRYQTAAHMAADLRCFLAGDPILARPPGIVRRTSRWVRRHRSSVALAGCVLLACGLLVQARVSQLRQRGSLAWITVVSEPPSCPVFLRRVDPTTLELLPEAEGLGVTPIRRAYLPTGDYRITIAAPDHSWEAEFDARLHETGPSHRVELRAGGSPRELDVDSDGGVTPPAATRLSARIIPTAEVANDDDMVLVKEGSYPFGWRDPSADSPSILADRRTVVVDAFYIDRREVSIAEYKAFVEATGHASPWHFKERTDDTSVADLPIMDITMADAAAYARWAGKRLPTMFEWQAAACGPDGARYPWGNDPGPLDGLRSVTGQDVVIFRGTDGRAKYDAYKRVMVPVREGAADRIGLLHTLDNVREYTSTVDPATGVVASAPYLDLPTREWDLRIVGSAPVNRPVHFVGIRCAKSAGPPHASSPSRRSHAIQDHRD